MRAKISVTGGKGGTGKSTIAVNLALLLAKHRDLVMADLDVEAPNDHILLGVDLENEEPVKIMVPKIIYEKCIKCGACAQVCDTGAMLLDKNKLPFLLPRLCSGCRACYYACPTDAIIEGKRIIGYTYQTPITKFASGFTLVTGVLREGEEHTPPVVLSARERAYKIAEDILLIDTSAGTGSHVATALEDSDILVGVTEPTPLGLHDLELILQLGEIMNIESWIVINRANIGPEEKIHEIAKKYNSRIIGRIPFSNEMVKAYVKGYPFVLQYPDHKITHVLEEIANKIMEVI